MNCPVCNTELGFSIDDLEDFYYDCSYCQSALLFTKGECQIVSQGKKPDESPAQTPDKSLDKPVSQSLDKPVSQSLDKPVSQSQSLDKPTSQSLDSSAPTPTLQTNLTKEETISSKTETYIDPEIAHQLHQTQEEEFVPGTEEPDDKSLLNESPSDFEEVTEVPETPEEDPNEFKEEAVEPEEASFVFNEKDNLELQQPAKEDFSEELEFSKNKDNKQTGLYLYRLFLNEINSQALKEKVLSLIEDAQMELEESEHNSYKEEILHKGKVVFPKLSAIQMYVILHELMGLPLKVHWEQSHLADS